MFPTLCRDSHAGGTIPKVQILFPWSLLCHVLAPLPPLPLPLPGLAPGPSSSAWHLRALPERLLQSIQPLPGVEDGGGYRGQIKVRSRGPQQYSQISGSLPEIDTFEGHSKDAAFVNWCLGSRISGGPAPPCPLLRRIINSFVPLPSAQDHLS